MACKNWMAVSAVWPTAISRKKRDHALLIRSREQSFLHSFSSLFVLFFSHKPDCREISLSLGIVTKQLNEIMNAETEGKVYIIYWEQWCYIDIWLHFSSSILKSAPNSEVISIFFLAPLLQYTSINRCTLFMRAKKYILFY